MITIIAAMTKTGVIGKGNALPWNIPDEMKHFKTTTAHATVIMGLNTFYSIGKPLPNRNNIILARPDITIPGAEVCSSIEDALHLARSYNKEIFIIGGAYTYAQFLQHADRMIISYIQKEYEGDVFFPAVNMAEWKEVKSDERQEFKVIEFMRQKR